MSRTGTDHPILPVLASVVAAVIVAGGLGLRGAPPDTGQAGRPAGARLPSTARGDWPHYNGDVKGSRYAPLDQITAANFNKLEVAWRFKTDNLGPRPEYKLEGTPLVVNGVLYATGGTRRAVVALDAKTGELKWVHSLDEGRRAEVAPRKLSGRGLSYWTDGQGDERIYYYTIGYRLVALDAKTGQVVPSFGRGGMIDLKEGVVFGKGGRQVQIPLETGEVGVHSTPLIVNDIIIASSAMAEGLWYEYSTNAKGVIRAYDVRTGKLLWRWDTMPGPGEPGHETWEEGSWAWTGNVGAWTELSADPEAGLLYVPVETPTIDVYGGNRPGDNLYAESLVALDLKTGKKRWHFQFVHHPLWDYDISGWPLVMDVTVDGRPRKIVTNPTKQCFLYTFDRLTGEPIWPIVERPVPQSDVPGEKTAPTQPFPTRPPAICRNYIAPEDVIDFTPALRQQALENLKKFRWLQTPFVPYLIPNDQELGAVQIGNTMGGVNWPGSGFDPETGIVYTHVNNSSVGVGVISPEYFELIKPEAQIKQGRIPIWESPHFGQPETPRRKAEEAARRALTEGLEGLPIVKPPYGMMVAVDMNTGTIKWQVPHGDTPDLVRNHPRLQGLTIPKTGQNGIVGVVITKTLVIAGDPQVTAPPGRPRGAMLRAYDKATGAEVGAVWLPAPQSGSPMTYMVDGRQFIVVAVGGGTYSSEYIAFALPESELKKATSSGQP
jgi:quinoprotein glucose dehydrogenase